jgi:hypothetical protein
MPQACPSGQGLLSRRCSVLTNLMRGLFLKPEIPAGLTPTSRGPVPRHIERATSDTIAMVTWPATAHKLVQLQHALGESTPERWQPPTTLQRIGACFVCFEPTQDAGTTGDAGFAAAAVTYRRRVPAGGDHQRARWRAVPGRGDLAGPPQHRPGGLTPQLAHSFLHHAALSVA